MKREFCTYEQSLALKELGFDEECLAGYELADKSIYIAYVSDDGIQFNSEYYLSAPLIQQAFRFFREKYGLCINIHDFGTDWFYAINKFKYSSGTDRVEAFYSTYEEAEQACLDKLIELAKEYK